MANVVQAKQSLGVLRSGYTAGTPNFYPSQINNKLQRSSDTTNVSSYNLKVIDGKLVGVLEPSTSTSGKQPKYLFDEKYTKFKIESKYNVDSSKTFLCPSMYLPHIRYEGNGEFDFPDNPSDLDNPSGYDEYDFSFDSRIVGHWDGIGAVKYQSWLNDTETYPDSYRPWIVTDGTLIQEIHSTLDVYSSYASYTYPASGGEKSQGFYVAYVTQEEGTADLYLNLSKFYQDEYYTINSIKIFDNGTDNGYLANCKVLAMSSNLIYIAMGTDNSSISSIIRAYSYSTSGISGLSWSYDLALVYAWPPPGQRFTLSGIRDCEATSTGVFITYQTAGLIHVTSSGVSSMGSWIINSATALTKSKDNYYYWLSDMKVYQGEQYLLKTTEDLTQTEIFKIAGSDINPSGEEEDYFAGCEIISIGYNYTNTKSIILYRSSDTKIIKCSDSDGSIEYEVEGIPIFCTERKVYYYLPTQTEDERFTIHSLDFLLDSTSTIERGNKVDLDTAYIRPKYQHDIMSEGGEYIAYPIYGTGSTTGLTGENTYTLTPIYFDTFEVSIVQDGTNGESRIKFFLELNLNLADVSITISFPEFSTNVSGTSNANGEITIYSPYLCGDSCFTSWIVNPALDIGGTPSGYIYTPESNTEDFKFTGTYYYSNGQDYTLALPNPALTNIFFNASYLYLEYSVGTYKSIPLQYRIKYLSDNPSDDESYSEWKCTNYIWIIKSTITYPYSFIIECQNPYNPSEVTESITYTLTEEF